MQTLKHQGTWGISSAGRAPALQAGGRRFDPVILHQSPTHSILYKESDYALAIEPVSKQLKA